MAIVIVTHDLGVVAEMADEIAVMYAGRIVEIGLGRAPLLRARAPLHVGPVEVDPDARRPARGRISCRSRALRPASSTARRAATSIRAARTPQPDHARIDPQLEPVGQASPATASRACSRRTCAAACGRELRAGRMPAGGAGASVGLTAARREHARCAGRAAGGGARPGQALPDHPRDRPAAQGSARSRRSTA